jgi:hypothetical protein
MASRKEQKERARQQRLAAERAAAEQAARTRRMWIAGGAVAVVAVAAIIAVVVATSGGGGGGGGGSHPELSAQNLGPVSALGHLAKPGSPGARGAEGVPVPAAPALAPAGSPGPGQSVDGISCQTGEQTLFHVHTHLTVFVDGKPRQVPQGVGIAPPRQVQQSGAGRFVASGACFSWLHTHASDGIVHIESPVKRSFTLGNFFDVWGQPLGPDQVGPVNGPVTAFYNGRHYIGNPQNIPLGNDVQIQLDVGRPLVAPEKINFPSGL